MFTQWLRAEEPTSDWWDRDNPLNNGLGSGGGSGLGSYASVVTAAFDVARNLEQTAYGYPMVARDLATSAAPAITARAIWRSSWAAGHYGFGADWDTEPVPSVAAPPSAWRDPSCPATGYPDGVVGPCGTGFTTSGASWHTGSPGGYRGAQLWSLARTGVGDLASWRPRLGEGTYAVSAFVPADFADANATYVVTDATGAHRVVVDQEPFDNTWAPLGDFLVGRSTPIRVSLSAVSAAPLGTYVTADAMRFEAVPTPATAHGARRAASRVTPQEPPSPPQDVTAVAGDASAAVSWLAPSKDGGRDVVAYRVTAKPGGASCRSAGHVAAPTTCTVGGLHNGTTYTFVVRAANPVGTSRASSASSPARPTATSSIRIVVDGAAQLDRRIVLHAIVSPRPTSGVVLFSINGQVLKNCADTRLVSGHAGCSLRLESTQTLGVLASYSGSVANSGAEGVDTIAVSRDPTSMRDWATPDPAPSFSIVRVRAWGLPHAATGEVVFVADARRLCVAAVDRGGGACGFRLRLPVGVHTIVANYLGDHDYLGTRARITLRVLATST